MWIGPSGGHNAGIVSEPGHRGRRYRMATKEASGICLGPDEWLTAAATRNGSWWEAWQSWLSSHSGNDRVSPPGIGALDRGLPALADAPGSYVFQK